MYKKGFTLIELLVVIAIIGLLASVVLGSLNAARDKAVDAKIKEQLTQMRSQAALYFDSQVPASYDGLDVDPTMLNLFDSAMDITGEGDFRYCGAPGEISPGSPEWYAYARLKAIPGSIWYVDSLGASQALTLGVGLEFDACMS
jgi:prepilin-type N-terminal cleavage/methylation domain-containing protein